MASMIYLRSRPRSLLRAAAPACSSSSRSHLFSSSSSPPDFSHGNPQTSENNQSNSRSSFSDLKSHLRDGEPNQQPPRKPFSFSQAARSEPNLSSSIYLKEIRDNLKGFRSSEQAPQISFQKLFQKIRAEPLPTDKSSSTLSSLAAIKDSLSQMSVSETRKTPSYHSKFRDRLNLRQNVEQTNEPSSRVIDRTTEGLPLSIFGKELLDKSNEGGVSEDVNNNSLVKEYSCPELGEQLRKLRPEGLKKGENWFSISELNQRLIKLREIENQKPPSTGPSFAALKATLSKMQKGTYEQDRVNSARRVDILSSITRGTPNYMFSTPKEHLVEKYFHPDNMSAAEKLKIELKRVRDEFKMSDTDCGSTRVQIAQLTTEIHYLSKCLHKKDKHSRKGLIAKVQMRKKLLKYLRRTDWDSYCFILSSLGLRDNPGYKQVKQ